MATRLALAKRRVAELLDWLDSGERPTDAQLTEYQHRLDTYARTGRQYGLPLNTALPYSGVATRGQREPDALAVAATSGLQG